MLRSLEQDRTLDTATQALELDSSAIAKTKSQISGLVSEIAALSQSHRDPVSFAQSMLPRLVHAMAAHGAALWSLRDGTTWEVIHGVGIPRELLGTRATDDVDRSNSVESKIESSIDSLEALLDVPSEAVASRSVKSSSPSLPPLSYASPSHQLLLERVQQERQPVLVPPSAQNAMPGLTNLTGSDPSNPINPTQFALIFAPVLVESELGVWWLQVVQPPSGGVATQRGYLRFVAQIADLTADFLKTHRLREHQHQTRITQATARLIDYAVNDEANVQSKEFLSTVIARIRDILECDQVFLVERSYRGKPWRTLVASGMRTTNHQSEGNQSISNAAEWLIDQANAHQIEDHPLSILAEDRRLRKNTPGTVSTITLCSSSPDSIYQPSVTRDVEPADEGIIRFNAIFSSAITSWVPIVVDPKSRKTGVGLLVYWSWPSSRPSESQLNVLLSHCKRTSLVVLRATRPSSLAIWLGRNGTTRSHQSRRLLTLLASRTLLVAIAITVIAGIGFISVPIQLTAPATIIAAKQSRHYANSDATVRAVHVDYGQRVEPQQLLLELEDRNLERLFEQTKAEVRQNDQKQRNLTTRLLRDQELSETARYTLEGELEGIRKLAPQTENRLNDLRAQIDSLMVRAHTAGIVTTWNAAKSLQDRPVRTGQLLLSVQASDSQWIVEANMPQHQSGQFLKLTDDHANSRIPLEATCSLASLPLKDIPALFRPDDRSAIVAISSDSIHDAVFRLRFSIPQINDVSVMSGSAATLRINGGNGPLWKALFGDAINGAWAKWRLWSGL